MFALNAIILYACYAGSIFLGKKKFDTNQTQEISQEKHGLSPESRLIKNALS